MLISVFSRFKGFIIEILPSSGAVNTTNASPFFLNAISGKNSWERFAIFKPPKLALKPKLDRELTASLGPIYWCEISTASLTAAPLFLIPCSRKRRIVAEIIDFSNSSPESICAPSISEGERFASAEEASFLTGSTFASAFPSRFFSSRKSFYSSTKLINHNPAIAAI